MMGVLKSSQPDLFPKINISITKYQNSDFEKCIRLITSQPHLIYILVDTDISVNLNYLLNSFSIYSNMGIR